MERLRRSFFFVPGGNEKLLTKALRLDADCLCIDLEDSVAADKKATAREAVVEALRVSDFGKKEKIVRINSIWTEYGRPDIQAVIRGRPDTLLLPKVNRDQDISDYDAILTEEEKKAGLPTTSIGLVAMIESALGIANIDAIALASARMKGLLFGAGDYTRETRGRITADRFELLYPMTRILLAARIAGMTPSTLLTSMSRTRTVWKDTPVRQETWDMMERLLFIRPNWRSSIKYLHRQSRRLGALSELLKLLKRPEQRGKVSSSWMARS